ncbi:MAG: hypothetical protein ABDH32_08015 [Candidatus Caldarchaeales archaeon]
MEKIVQTRLEEFEKRNETSTRPLNPYTQMMDMFTKCVADYMQRTNRSPVYIRSHFEGDEE